MITKAIIKSNPKESTFTIEVDSKERGYYIVRIFNPEQKIIDFFGWYIAPGANIATTDRTRFGSNGTYKIDFIDLKAKPVFSFEFNRQAEQPA